jgi:hypothetical protein
VQARLQVSGATGKTQNSFRTSDAVCWFKTGLVFFSSGALRVAGAFCAAKVTTYALRLRVRLFSEVSRISMRVNPASMNLVRKDFSDSAPAIHLNQSSSLRRSSGLGSW